MEDRLHALLDEPLVAHQAGVQGDNEVAPVLLRELVCHRSADQRTCQELHHQREVAALVALVEHLDGAPVEHLEGEVEREGAVRHRA